MTEEKFNEYQEEIKRLKYIDNSNTNMIDRQESIKETFDGLQHIDVDLVYDTLNAAASVAENISKKWYELEVNAKTHGDNIGSNMWNLLAQEKAEHAKDIRHMLTHLYRMQSSNNKLLNLKKQMGEI
mgnify:CR=1 FL=1|tara:strand:+ start:296 stop:676 length:381 start_codon:yes stop_codon:yes gene_type:complete